MNGIEDVDLHGGFARERAEAAGDVADADARGQTDGPAAEALQETLERRHVRRLRHFAIADDDVRAAAHDRRDELRDVGAGVLIVGVGVDDDVRAEAECGVDAGQEGGCKSAMRLELHDVRRAGFARGVGGVVGGAVVDDDGFDGGDAVDFLRNIAKRLRDRRFFVEGGDLNDKLHAWCDC